MKIRNFCYASSYNIMAGLAQELKILPNKNYSPKGYNSSRVLTLKLTNINPTYLSKIQSMENELSMWAGLSDKNRIRISFKEHSIWIEIPKPKWKEITVDTLEQRKFIKRGHIATIGLGIQDEPKRLDYRLPDIAHTFVIGQTRSGKTNTQRLIAWNLVRNTTPNYTKLLILDVAKKGRNWKDFSNLPHMLYPTVVDIETADKILSWLESQIDFRASNDITSPKIFLFVDELKALIDDSNVASDYLSRIASIGGEFGIHLVLSTQYPQISMIGKAELKRNITTRLCGKVDDSIAAVNALGIKNSGAESLMGYGDFLLKDSDGLSRVSVALLSNKDIDKLERIDNTDFIQLPDMDNVNRGPIAEPIEPEHVAKYLFECKPGLNRFTKDLGIGVNKGYRIKDFADRIVKWGIENGYSRFDCNQEYLENNLE